MIDIMMPVEQNEGTEASLGRWLKQTGEAVKEHEPLVEINTDKVTIEVPAPGDGVLASVRKAEGDAVLAGEVLGQISSDGEATVAALTERGGEASVSEGDDRPVPSGDAEAGYSPAVRRLLREHGLEASAIPKRGRGGRLSIADVEASVGAAPGRDGRDGAEQTAGTGTLAGRRVAHTPMRRAIATHMTRSVQTAPHVTSVFEADLSKVLADRTRRKGENGDAVPSVTAYLIAAAVKAIKAVPEVNSRWHEGYLEVFDTVNFGVGTALESGGLVVPVIRGADAMDLETTSERLNALTAKARAGRLTQSDMAAGTFTLSNHGVSGSLLAAPIILPHGQAAILGAGKMQKRVIVCETGGRELFRVRPMMYVTLTVDHRVLDGQQTNGFLTAFVGALEAF